MPLQCHRTIGRSRAVSAMTAVGVATALLMPVTAAHGAVDDTIPAPRIVGTEQSRSVQRVARPPIRRSFIPFGPTRKRQMAHYSTLHYGEATWQLRPRGIVQHFTGTRSLRSVFATFRSNAPDPELGQRPGVCTHFVIDRDGTIHQLVRLSLRCRHTVGLNHRTIGVEHVGLSDREVMRNPRQRAASVALSAWLAERFGIATGDVIGHNESLRSRFHHELYRPWRCQTHGDFGRATMNRYRRHLNARLAGSAVSTAPPRWSPTSC